jgi:YD repeat-containing protein
MSAPANWKTITRLSLATLAFISLNTPPANATTTYLYDPAGRLTVIMYDNGVCIAYSYDADGERISEKTFGAGAGVGPLKWGGGNWGCTSWSAN